MTFVTPTSVVVCFIEKKKKLIYSSILNKPQHHLSTDLVYALMFNLGSKKGMKRHKNKTEKSLLE